METAKGVTVVAGNASTVQGLGEGLQVGIEEAVVDGIAREDLRHGSIKRGVDGTPGEANIRRWLPGRKSLRLGRSRVDEESEEGLDEGPKALGGDEAVVGGLVVPADDPGPEVWVLNLAT
jgi:hypothetical protein